VAVALLLLVAMLLREHLAQVAQVALVLHG
jgi:hypothetical protein